MNRNRLGRVRLSLSQVASRLGVSLEVARRLVVDGPIDGIQVGRRVVVELGALEAYLAGA